MSAKTEILINRAAAELKAYREIRGIGSAEYVNRFACLTSSKTAAARVPTHCWSMGRASSKREKLGWAIAAVLFLDGFLTQPGWLWPFALLRNGLQNPQPIHHGILYEHS